MSPGTRNDWPKKHLQPDKRGPLGDRRGAGRGRGRHAEKGLHFGRAERVFLQSGPTAATAGCHCRVPSAASVTALALGAPAALAQLTLAALLLPSSPAPLPPAPRAGLSGSDAAVSVSLTEYQLSDAGDRGRLLLSRCFSGASSLRRARGPGARATVAADHRHPRGHRKGTLSRLGAPGGHQPPLLFPPKTRGLPGAPFPAEPQPRETRRLRGASAPLPAWPRSSGRTPSSGGQDSGCERTRACLLPRPVVGDPAPSPRSHGPSPGTDRERSSPGRTRVSPTGPALEYF